VPKLFGSFFCTLFECKENLCLWRAIYTIMHYCAQKHSNPKSKDLRAWHPRHDSEQKFSEKHKHPLRTQTAWAPGSRSSTRAKLLRDHGQPACFLEKEGFSRPAGLNEPKHFLYLPPFRQELAKAPRDLENNFEAALDDLWT